MKHIHTTFLFITTCLLLPYKNIFASVTHTPRTIIVCIVDQLAYYHLQHLHPYLTGGFKTLLNRGFIYDNAHFDTAVPGTSCDHATLATGTYARSHGIVANYWIDAQNNKIPADYDPQFPLLDAPLSGNGASAHAMMVDTLSDQMILARTPLVEHHAIAISLKARASVMCAGKLGKAFWFNKKTGNFTSSTAYFDALPAWVEAFNTHHNPLNNPVLQWHLQYRDSKRYAQYITAAQKYHPAPALADTTIALNTTATGTMTLDEQYTKTPQSTELLLRFARQCLDVYKPTQRNQKLLLWLSISTLDKIGHTHGPWSQEAIDYLYHLDHELASFIKYVQRTQGKNNVLFVLTADHGAAPIPELLNTAPVRFAQRINPHHIIATVNAHIHKQYGIKQFLVRYQSPGFYINRTLKLTGAQKDILIEAAKKVIAAADGIQHVWSSLEVQEGCSPTLVPYQHQLMMGRSPDIMCQPYPYHLIDENKTGVDHNTPYNYDTHVPLIVYWPGHVPRRHIYDTVSMTQLAPTLAHIMRIPAPSSATTTLLPELPYQRRK